MSEIGGTCRVIESVSSEDGRVESARIERMEDRWSVTHLPMYHYGEPAVERK